MSRIRDFMIVSVPAAFLAFAALPMLDKPVSIAVAAETIASARPSETERAAPAPAATRSADEAPAAPTIRTRPRVGCEGAISSLAGQEARRLLPSRCLV